MMQYGAAKASSCKSPSQADTASENCAPKGGCVMTLPQEILDGETWARLHTDTAYGVPKAFAGPSDFLLTLTGVHFGPGQRLS
eukprot:3939159-Rhodomonas_salina.2